jgi:D-inositol-3-phosphate glycosyltransferase
MSDKYNIIIRDERRRLEMDKLRIAMLSAHSCPVGNLGAKDTGGMSVYIRELAHELGRQGHSVDVYTRVHDPNDAQFYYLGEQARLIHLRAGQKDDINKLILYSYLPEFTCNLENFRKDNDWYYDLVFSHYWLSGWVGKYLQQWWQVPHIAMFHTLGAVKNSLGIGEDEPELRIVTERDVVSNCQRIIATTEREKEELIHHYGAWPDKVSTVPCGVNMEIFQPIDKLTARRKLGLADDKILLFVGRIDPLKGIELLLKAVSHLRNIKGLRLVIIGGGEDSQPEIDRLQRLAGELDIADTVSFRGLVKHDELPHFYSAADVCVIPSYYESFGLVAVESLACGTPVVATDVGNLKNIIHQGENGYLVADNNPLGLAQKIDLMLSKPDFDVDSSGKIRASVSRYSWPNIAEAIIEEFRSVLSNQMTPVA